MGLRISAKKTELMTLNVTNPSPVRVNNRELQHTDKFTYLGSIIQPQGGTQEDIKSRLGKARGVFRSMDRIWKSTQYSTKTKTRLYQSCIISTLLYGSECWRITETDLNKLRAFHTTCLRRILRIYWPMKVSNEEVLRRCNLEDLGNVIAKRRWTWIGHILRREPSSLVRTALHWTPEGKRRKGRPRMTWRRTVEGEMKAMRRTWGTLDKMAQDRAGWRTFVAALDTTRCNR